MTSQIAATIVLVLGFVGVVVCIPALFGIWMMHSRISNAGSRLFGATDEALAQVDSHVESTRTRVLELKVTADDLQAHVKERLRAESLREFVEQYEVLQKADRLTLGLDRADDWIDVVEMTSELLEAALEAAAASGFSVSPQLSPKRFAGELDNLRKLISNASGSVDKVRDWAVDVESGETLRKDAIELIGRLALTMSSIDESCEEFREILRGQRESLNTTKLKFQRWTRWIAIALTVIVIWIAAGQAALFKIGLDGFRHARTVSESVAQNDAVV